MEENIIRTCVESGMSHRQIAEKFGKSQTTIRYWLSKYGLKTDPYGINKGIIPQGKKQCAKCKEIKPLDGFHGSSETRFTSYCKSCNIKNVLDRQTNFKLQCLDYKGGRHCTRCSYDKSYVALEFHHRDSIDKEFSISKFKLYKFIDAVKKELDKCDVLCSNCHKELHHELANQRNRRQEV